MLNAVDIELRIDLLCSLIPKLRSNFKKQIATNQMLVCQQMLHEEKQKVREIYENTPEQIVLAWFDKLGIKLPRDQINFVGY